MGSLRRPGLAKLIWFGMGQFGLDQFDWVCFGLDWFGLVCILKKASNLKKLVVWFGLV